MTSTHTEATPSRLIKPESIQLLFHTKANMSSQIIYLAKEIKALLNHQSKLELDISFVKKCERKAGQENC